MVTQVIPKGSQNLDKYRKDTVVRIPAHFILEIIPLLHSGSVALSPKPLGFVFVHVAFLISSKMNWHACKSVVCEGVPKTFELRYKQLLENEQACE